MTVYCGGYPWDSRKDCMGAKYDKHTTGGMTSAARRVLAVVATGLIACLVGVALGTAIIPVPDALKGMLPTLGQQADSAAGEYTVWDTTLAPEYYRIVGASRFDRSLEPGETEYGELDPLGRATYARACVTQAMVEEGLARERGNLQELAPSGWGHNAEVSIPLATGDTYRGYLWNRSHLLAKSLGGSDDLRNLITGTRTQNVGSNSSGGGSGGMAFGEWLVRDWLAAHADGWVCYAATPVYEGAEPVCRSVMVDILSSDGTLDMRVEVYNAAQGIAIDYATGAFEQVEAAPEAEGTSTGVIVDPAATADPAAQDYVVNTNTGKFHLPNCESVGQMSDHNRQDVHTTRDDLIAQGYEPCGGCRP